jgi:hypothetical protein
LPSRVKRGNRVAYPGGNNRVAYPGGKAINHKTLAAIPRNPTKNNKKNFLAGWNRLGIGWGCSEPQWLHFNAFLGIHSAQREHFLLGSNNNDAKNALPKTTTKTSEEINKKIKTQALTSLLIIHHTAKNRGQYAGGRFSRAP